MPHSLYKDDAVLRSDQYYLCIILRLIDFLCSASAFLAEGEVEKSHGDGLDLRQPGRRR